MLSLVLWTKATGHSFYWLDKTREIWKSWDHERVVCFSTISGTRPVIVTTPYPWLHLLKNQTWSFLKRRRDRPEKYFYEFFYFSTKISTCSPPHWSLRASSVAYFFTYSATFFLYSSGLPRFFLGRLLAGNIIWLTCEDTLLLHLHWEDLWGWGMSEAGAGKTRIYWRDHTRLSRLDWWHPNTQFLTPRQCWDDTPKEQQTKLGLLKSKILYNISLLSTFPV